MVNSFRITTVDMDGHQGRDFHPEETDIGLIVTPLRLDVYYYEQETGIVESVLDNDGRLYEAALPLLNGIEEESEGRYIETCYTCVTPDGRILELMDFELEPIFEGEPIDLER